MAEITVAIIGLKRVGASFGLAIKRYLKAPGAQHKITIVGSDESAAARSAARKLNAIDSEVRSLGAAVEGADLIVLSLPYSKYDEYYETISADLKAGAVILDFAPLKLRTIERARKHLPKQNGELTAYAVGATAILNAAYLYDTDDDTETARADLFDKGTLILSPDAQTRGDAIQLASDFAALIGMSTHFTDPAEHDGLMAAMEALPLLTNLALFQSVAKNVAWDDLKRVSNPVFAHDTVSLAAFSPQDAAAAVHGNGAAVARYLDAMIENLSELRTLLRTADELTLAEAFAEVSDQHDEWLRDRSSNRWSAPADETATPTAAGLLRGRFLGRIGQGKKDEKK